MSVSHMIMGYDKRTERLAIQHSVPQHRVSEAASLAHIEPDDDMAGCYPLDQATAVKIGLLIDEKLNVELYDWFLEPLAADGQIPHLG